MLELIPLLNRSALECIYLQYVTSVLECVPSVLNVKLVVCICTGRSALECGCNYLNEEEVRWKCAHLHIKCAGCAFVNIFRVHCSALGVRSLAYLKCIVVHCSALGVHSSAYLECVHLYMRSALECNHLALRFASGLYQYERNYEIEENIMYSLNSNWEQSVNCQTKTLNYKYHIIWPCPCITSSATHFRGFCTFSDKLLTELT